jgi:hypothetical protein
MTQLSQNELEALQQLVADLLDLPNTMQLLIGRLPDQLPVELPIPDEAQLLGCLVANHNYFQIFLDVGLSLKQIKTFYRQHLLDAGWQEQSLIPAHKKGFMASLKSYQNQLNRSLKFRNESQEIELGIQVSPRSNPPGRMKLHLSLVQSPETEVFRNLKLPPFPVLEDPPQVVRLNSSGGSEMEYSSHVHLETELSSQALLFHYAAQFEQADWIQCDGGEDGALLWKSFSITDNKGQSWLGLLNIAKLGSVHCLCTSITAVRIQVFAANHLH